MSIDLEKHRIRKESILSRVASIFSRKPEETKVEERPVNMDLLLHEVRDVSKYKGLTSYELDENYPQYEYEDKVKLNLKNILSIGRYFAINVPK